ncbi:glucosylglycerolphosphate phosphatase, partial [Xanthomonas sp. Kuri4-2]
FLRARLAAPPFALPAATIEDLVGTTVLDNAVSPTLNANRLHQWLGGDAARYLQLQQALTGFMDALLQQAAAQGLGASFFVHYAPNLGRDTAGRERWKPAAGADAGTTDFQFMLRGAVKEAGVLALLNRHYQRRTGHCPLGEGFTARDAPRDPEALRALARARFDPAHMPCIVGVGDTVGSVRA